MSLVKNVIVVLLTKQRLRFYFLKSFANNQTHNCATSKTCSVSSKHFHYTDNPFSQRSHPIKPKPSLKCFLIVTRTSRLQTQGISAVLHAIRIELTRSVVCDIAPWEPFNEDNQPLSDVLAGVVAVF